MKCTNVWIKFLLIFLMKIKVITMKPSWHESNVGSKFLIDTEEKYNWYQAWNECARYDAHLVAIESEEKNNILIKLLTTINEKAKHLWIGGHVVYDKMSFNWAVNEHEFNFTNWDTDEVSHFGAKRQCVYIVRHEKNFPWNFVNCDAEQFGFICEETVLSEEAASNEGFRGNEQRNGSMYDGSIYGLIG